MKEYAEVLSQCPALSVLVFVKMTSDLREQAQVRAAAVPSAV